MKNKRIFISGGAGVIGKELVNKLHKLNATLFVGDLKPKPENWDKNILYRQGDLNYITKEEIDNFNPEIFIHLAATFERSTETYEFWKENYWHNISLSHHLMTLLKDSKKLKKVIFPSSYLIYNPDLYNFDKPQIKAYELKENDNILPRNLTGVAKLNHEIELRFLNEFKNKQFTSTCLRIFRGYGKGSRCVISRWVRDLLQNKEIRVYKKEGMFDYIYAEDIAEGIIKTIQNNIKGIVNFGTGKARKVEDIVNILKKHFPKMKYKEVDSDISYEASQANMDLFEKKCNWIPEIQIDEGIKKIINYEKNKKKVSTNTYNILITSISRKISLIKNIRKAALKLDDKIKIWGGDVDKNCIGQYFVDNFWLMPKIDCLTIDRLINFCNFNNIKYIIPSRDGELLYFTKYKNKLLNNNIHTMISNEKTVNICSDKFKFFNHLKENKLPFITTTLNIDNIESNNVVLKDRYGAGAINIGINLPKDNAYSNSKTLDNPIFQPYIKGIEYTVDMYIAKNKKIKGLIIRERKLVINGESHITITSNNKAIEKLCCKINECFDFYGHILFQFIVNKDNFAYTLECNPRFGGASNLSIECGLDSFYWFLLESNNVDISDYLFIPNKKKIKQITYNTHKIIKL